MIKKSHPRALASTLLACLVLFMLLTTGGAAAQSSPGGTSKYFLPAGSSQVSIDSAVELLALPGQSYGPLQVTLGSSGRVTRVAPSLAAQAFFVLPDGEYQFEYDPRRGWAEVLDGQGQPVLNLPLDREGTSPVLVYNDHARRLQFSPHETGWDLQAISVNQPTAPAADATRAGRLYLHDGVERVRVDGWTKIWLLPGVDYSGTELEIVLNGSAARLDNLPQGLAPHVKLQLPDDQNYHYQYNQDDQAVVVNTTDDRRVLTLPVSGEGLTPALRLGAEGVLTQIQVLGGALVDSSLPGQSVVDLQALPVRMGTPDHGEEFTLELVSDQELAGLEWEVAYQPPGEEVGYAQQIIGPPVVSADGKRVSFYLYQAGGYVVTVRLGSQSREIKFNVASKLAYDTGKVEGLGADVEPAEHVGVIKNQSWVKSQTLSEAELTDLLAGDQYELLQVVGYDQVYGLLVEYDESRAAALEALEYLRFEAGVSSVRPRVHVGENVFQGQQSGLDCSEDGLYPGDYGGCDAWYNGGNNWHLEYINAPDAWRHTTGSGEISIAVIENAFDDLHHELLGRVSVLTPATCDDLGLLWDSDDCIGNRRHGLRTAGVIGALANNESTHPSGLNMAGLNWESSLEFYRPFTAGSLRRSMDDNEVRVANFSGAIPIPRSYRESQFAERANNARHGMADFRAAMEEQPGELFVISAGNGAGNGLGTNHLLAGNRLYGVDARLASGATHYDLQGNHAPVANVVVVAALERESNNLAYYSNYGPSIDLAAPSAFLSLDWNQEFADYSGTSAAAPVVSGVASLVYAVYPGFSGAQVKEILLASAEQTATHRHARPGGELVELAQPVPIVNAKRAVQQAHDLFAAGVYVNGNVPLVPQPGLPEASVELQLFEPDQELDWENFVIDRVSWGLHAHDQQGGNRISLASGVEVPVPDDRRRQVITLPLDTSEQARRNYELQYTVTLLNTSSGHQVEVNGEHDFAVYPVDIIARDTTTLELLADVELYPMFSQLTLPSQSVVTDQSGRATIYTEAWEEYKVLAFALPDYEEGALFVKQYPDNIQSEVSVELTRKDAGAVGHLFGVVGDLNGQALSSASVRISGGAQTNGFFASASTDEKGVFRLTNISKTDVHGEAIDYFILEVSKPGYDTKVRQQIIVLHGKTRREDFLLLAAEEEEEEETTQVLYAPDFDAGDAGWSGTGMWQRQELSADSIANPLVEEGYVQLAPDEDAERAWLPAAFSGDYAWWYGDPATGNFIGQQADDDTQGSGGTSVEAHGGSLISPVIMLNAGSPMLSFRTWWEVESVNPNEEGYDLMDIAISTDGGANFTLLRRLNPHIDPNDPDRESKPYSSGGYNRAPQWVLEQIDLSDYAGQEVQLKFHFDTRDELYNGFRGWIVDAVEITGSGPTPMSSFRGVAPGGGAESGSEADFYNIHKKPLVDSQIPLMPARSK